jgi:parallel beta-helix repeat protein
MKIWIQKIFLISILCSLFTIPYSKVNAQTPHTYYVATDGSDGNPGTISQPFKTIQFSVNMVIPGDIIYLRSGTYIETVNVSKSGTHDQPITIAKYPGDTAEAIISGPSSGTGRAFQPKAGSAYWIIDGINFTSNVEFTIKFDNWANNGTSGGIDYYTFRNNVIHGQIQIYGAYNLFENNEIVGIPNTGDGNAVLDYYDVSHHNTFKNNNIHGYVHRGFWSMHRTHDDIFINNTVHDIGMNSGGTDGVCIDADGYGTVEWRHTISGNRLYRCGQMGISLENVYDTTIQNNIISDSITEGITLINYGPSETGGSAPLKYCQAGGENNQYGDTDGNNDCVGDLTNNKIIQNLIYHSGTDASVRIKHTGGVAILGNTIAGGTGKGISMSEKSPQITLKNNILSLNNNEQITTKDGLSSIYDYTDDHNLFFVSNQCCIYQIGTTYYSLSGYQSASGGKGVGSKSGDPKFVDSGNGNFRLLTNSPAIDAGVNIGVVKDLDGTNRPQGSGYDIGVYENSGNIYYVSTTGNDSNPGTQALPFLTIQKGVNSLIAGDQLMVRGGIYHEKINFPISGTANNYITLTNFPGEQVIIEGTGITLPTNDNNGLVTIQGKKYIKVSNITIQNSMWHGIGVSKYYVPDVISENIILSGITVINSGDTAIKVTGGNYITVENCTTRESNSSGIGIWSSNHILVDHNKIVNARNVDIPKGHEESISLAATTNFEVSYNDISLDGGPAYLGNEGIDCKEGSRFGSVHHNYIHNYLNEGGAIYIDAWDKLTGNIDIYANYLNSTANGIVVGSERGGTAENIKIFNNIVYKGGGGGIAVSYKPGYNGLRKNIEIYNNTIYQARWNGGAGIYIEEPNIDNIIIRNNIVYFNLHNGEIAATSVDMLPHIKASNNLVFGPKLCSNAYPNCVEISDNPPGYPDIYGNITQDPMFVNLNTPDLHLQSNSPGIGAGANLSALGVTTDLDDKPRPYGTTFDIGAYEYSPAVSPTPTLFPSPTNNPKPGDANNDQKVDGQDYVKWLTYYSTSSTGPNFGDFDNNSTVDGRDYVIWLTNYGK